MSVKWLELNSSSCSLAAEVTHLQLSEHRVIIDAGEEDPHGVSAIVEVGDAGSVQVAR